MIFNLRILTCWLFFTISRGEAQKLHSGHGSGFVRFLNFVKHPFHYLNTVKASSLVLASDFADCAFRCMQTPTCASVNVAAVQSLGDSELLWCELLASDKYRNPKSFRENATSHHFSITVSSIHKIRF